MLSSGAGGAGENLKSWNSEILAGWVTWEDVRFPGFQFSGRTGRREILAPTPTRRDTGDASRGPVETPQLCPGVVGSRVFLWRPFDTPVRPPRSTRGAWEVRWDWNGEGSWLKCFTRKVRVRS